MRIWLDGDRRTWTFIVAGFFSAMLAANEVPAAVLSAAVSLIVLWLAPRKTLIAYLPPALLVTAAFFATNWIAVQSLKPAQMHRSEGDNWYDYDGSYWKNRQGIDQGEKSAAVYSLPRAGRAPRHLFAHAHLVAESAGRRALATFAASGDLKLLHALGLGGNAVCLAFYIWWPGVDRNYGGNASGIPLGLLDGADVAHADVAGGRPPGHRRWSRGVGLMLLALSVVAASYPTWNPWSPPWIMNYLGYLGWL